MSVRMSPWVTCERFLGMTIEYTRNDDGPFESGNNICIVRCTEKINEMESKFNYLEQFFNTKGLKRNVPLPLEFLVMINWRENLKMFWMMQLKRNT